MKSTKYLHLTPVIIVVTGLFSLSSCDQDPGPSGTVAAGNSTVVLDLPTDTNTVDASKTLCDPFSQDPTHPAYAGASNGQGLLATLYYLPDGAPHYTNVFDYETNGIQVDASLYFSDINVPTRYFDLGFTTQAGSLLVNQDGDTLYEYFAIHFEGQITLGPNDPPGQYQFATLSDDGAVLAMDLGSGYQTVVDGNGTHPSRFVGSSFPIQLNAGSSIPFKFDYYQGPRYQIAFVVLMRPWPANPNDPQFGQEGNNMYFNWETVPSTATQTWEDILTRGWKVLTIDNYQLPTSLTSNPCVQAVPPSTSIDSINPPNTPTDMSSIIFTFSSNDPNATFICSLDGATASACTSPTSYSGLADGSHTFSVWATDNGLTDPTGQTYSWTVDTVAPQAISISSSSTNNSFTVTWTTSEPTTTGFAWGLGPNPVNVVPTDPNYVTSHSVTITGLQGGSVYGYVISGADDAGNTFQSNLLSVRTTN